MVSNPPQLGNDTTIAAEFIYNTSDKPLLHVIFVQGLLSTIMNIIVFLMTVTMPSLRNKTYVYYILCLSLSDILFGSSEMDHYFQSKLDVIPDWRCVFSTILSLSAILISLVQTFLICLERALCIKNFPANSKYFTDNRRSLIIVISWVSCILFNVILVTVSFNNCSLHVNTVESVLLECPYISTLFIIVEVILYVGILSLYLYLINNVRNLLRTVTAIRFDPENPTEVVIRNASSKLLSKIFKTLSIFVVMYFIIFSIVIVFSLIGEIFGLPPLGFMLIVIVFNLNGIVSPFLYIWRFEEIRNLFTCS